MDHENHVICYFFCVMTSKDNVIFYINRVRQIAVYHCGCLQHPRCHCLSQVLPWTRPHEWCARLYLWRWTQTISCLCEMASARRQRETGTRSHHEFCSGFIADLPSASFQCYCRNGWESMNEASLIFVYL